MANKLIVSFKGGDKNISLKLDKAMDVKDFAGLVDTAKTFCDTLAAGTYTFEYDKTNYDIKITSFDGEI